MNVRVSALLAGALLSVIYGLNHIIAKDVVFLLGPHAIVLIRVAFGTVAFWTLGLFYKSQKKIEKSDYLKLLGCVLVGLGINMHTLIMGIEKTTPINSSLIATLGPIIVLFLSIIFLKERAGVSKFLGIALGFVGAVVLIWFGMEKRYDAPNIPLGNFWALVSQITFATYFILIKPLSEKYGTITLMKFLFPIAVIFNFPFSISEFMEIPWGKVDSNITWKLMYILVGTTFLSYLFSTYSLKFLKASTLSAFGYAQPAVAIIASILLGRDELSIMIVTAMTLIFAGVYLVTKPSKLLKTK